MMRPLWAMRMFCGDQEEREELCGDVKSPVRQCEPYVAMRRALSCEAMQACVRQCELV
ncbi:hypothetical protein DY000_02040376 [Brassica cretica]|uniref:ShKT domain-containing protein n=1 Tax=Brassica cretica TaxID=69181 RepID=A0ABQ7BJX8_BRACR|nr:hypothetical protein DY000_02040376 [Brassica cretica]